MIFEWEVYNFEYTKAFSAEQVAQISCEKQECNRPMQTDTSLVSNDLLNKWKETSNSVECKASLIISHF